MWAPLDDIAPLFVGSAPDPLVRALGLAARALARADASALLASPKLAPLAALVGPIDHVGFIAPPTDLATCAAAARAAGFVRHHTFPSRVLARELGARVGRDEVPTTVFKASGPAGRVEVFMPDTPRAQLDAWMREASACTSRCRCIAARTSRAPSACCSTRASKRRRAYLRARSTTPPSTSASSTSTGRSKVGACASSSATRRHDAA